MLTDRRTTLILIIYGPVHGVSARCRTGIATFRADHSRFPYSVTFVGNWIYHHKVICINHTTYDGRHSQDSLNPHTHADFMVLAHEDDTDNNSILVQTNHWNIPRLRQTYRPCIKNFWFPTNQFLMGLMLWLWSHLPFGFQGEVATKNRVCRRLGHIWFRWSLWSYPRCSFNSSICTWQDKWPP